MRAIGVALAVFGLCACATAEELSASGQPTAPISSNAAPSIDAAAWLAGRWTGEGLGGVMEETWAPPHGGQMVGHFALIVDGEVAFYELMLIDVVETGLRMRVKHFNPDGTAWEERERWVTFEPVSHAPGELVFDALTLRRTGANEMTGVIRLRGRDGAVREEQLRYRRAPL